MAKKRVTIYVDENDWADIKKTVWDTWTYEKKISVGEYLIGLHKSRKSVTKKVAKIVENEKEMVKAIVVNVNPENQTITDDVSVPNSLDEQIDRTFKKVVEPELSIRAQYRLKNPTVMCPKCKNRNKDCVCGD